MVTGQGLAHVHYVCPRNGEVTRCRVRDREGRTHDAEHRREALVRASAPRPFCDTHRLTMVPA